MNYPFDPTRHVLPWKTPAAFPHRPAVSEGSTLVAVMCFIAVFVIVIGTVHEFTVQSGRQRARNASYAQSKLAAEAYADVIYARFCVWVNTHQAKSPGPVDIRTAGLPGQANAPAILDPSTAVITAPAGSAMAGYRLVVNNFTPKLVPVLPDDTEGTDFPNYADYTQNFSAYNSKILKYQTSTPGYYDKTKSSVTYTYKLVVTAAPVKATAADPAGATVTRYIQMSRITPFEYARFNNGTLQDGGSNRSYTGPLYAAGDMYITGSNVSIAGQLNYVGNFYGAGNQLNNTSNLTFSNGGGLRPTTAIELIPNLVSVLDSKTDSNGFVSRANTVEAGSNNFSTRELIEVPVAGVIDPPEIAQNRIYNQADIRIRVKGSTITVSKVDKNKTDAYNTNLDIPLSASDPLAISVLKSISLRQPTDPTAFIDSNLGNAKLKTVDINVGVLTDYIDKNPSSAISTIYVIDETASGNGQPNNSPVVRFYNGGVLPTNGLTFGTDNMAYIKGDWNTGTKLIGAVDFSTGTQDASTTPPSNALPSNVTATADQTTNSNYTAKPSGIFADSVTELTQNWNDANSTGTRNGMATTYNLVEAFGTGAANERSGNDTFTNAANSSIRWLEYWGARRTTSGSEMQLWHSKYYLNNWKTLPYQTKNTFYAPSVTKGINLKWGTTVFSRGRYYRRGGIPNSAL